MPEFGNGEQALGCFNLLEVARHVGSQDHVNDERSEFPELFARQIDQYVAIFFPHQSVFDQNRMKRIDLVLNLIRKICIVGI